MKQYKIGIQCSSIGQRCGVYTYSCRVRDYLNKMTVDKNGDPVKVEAYLFERKLQPNTDLISVQYEPGIIPPYPMGDGRVSLHEIMNENSEPVVVTVHHTNGLDNMYGMVDGFIFHSDDQITKKPFDYTIIEHPSLVFPNKDVIELRKKYGLPLDKKIMGTAGFITGTGKNLPLTVYNILKNMNDDEFLYLITSFWKGGDYGTRQNILDVVKQVGKENNFRLDVDFVNEETLNEKLQCCNLLWSWCGVGPNDKGSQSGIAADMYGTRRKLIVKDSAHYSYIGSQDKVEIGSEDPKDFAMDVLNLLRTGDLKDVPDPTKLSWENRIKDYLEYFEGIIGDI
jgi:hypothetical protein